MQQMHRNFEMLGLQLDHAWYVIDSRLFLDLQKSPGCAKAGPTYDLRPNIAQLEILPRASSNPCLKFYLPFVTRIFGPVAQQESDLRFLPFLSVTVKSREKGKK